MVEQVQADIAEQDEPRPQPQPLEYALAGEDSAQLREALPPFHDLSKRGPAAQATPDSAVSWQATLVRRPVSRHRAVS